MLLLKLVPAILIRPTQTWTFVSPLSISSKTIFLGYILPLISLELVGATAELIEFVWTREDPQLPWGQFYCLSLVPGWFGHGLWQLVVVYLLAQLVSSTAPFFSGESNEQQALKVIAFALTPVWLANLFMPIPFFSLDRSIPILAQVYAVYLLYLGLSILMRSSQPRAIAYSGCIAAILWIGLNGQNVLRWTAGYIREQPAFSQNARTAFGMFAIMAVVAGVVLYEKHASLVRRTLLYGGGTLAALWLTSKTSMLAVMIDDFVSEWPSLDESVKTITVVIGILMLTGIVVFLERRRSSSSND